VRASVHIHLDEVQLNPEEIFTSRICKMEKKYFFNQSSKYHMTRYSFVTDGWRRGWSRKYLRNEHQRLCILEEKKNMTPT